MKTKVLLFFGVLLVSLSVFAQQRGVRIAYVDMEYILENVEEYREANEQLDAKVQKWKLELEQEQNVINQFKKDLMAEKVLLTNELIAEREEEIKILEKEMFDYQQDRFGPNGDLMLSKQRLIQPIQDQVFNEVQKIGQSKNYDMIVDRSADFVMLYADKRLDLSELVLKAISRTRKVSVAREKVDKRNAIDDFEDEAPAEREMTDALKERISQSEEAQLARDKAAADKRDEQLKLREERKKAYDERRKKLLEERDAKKKETQEKENTEN